MYMYCIYRVSELYQRCYTLTFHHSFLAVIFITFTTDRMYEPYVRITEYAMQWRIHPELVSGGVQNSEI